MEMNDFVICDKVFTLSKFFGTAVSMTMFFAFLFIDAILDGGVL